MDSGTIHTKSVTSVWFYFYGCSNKRPEIVFDKSKVDAFYKNMANRIGDSFNEEEAYTKCKAYTKILSEMKILTPSLINSANRKS